jgi:hypothetical protein
MRWHASPSKYVVPLSELVYCMYVCKLMHVYEVCIVISSERQGDVKLLYTKLDL